MAGFFARFRPAHAHCKRCGVEVKSKRGKELHPLSCKDAIKYVRPLFEASPSDLRARHYFACTKCKEKFPATEEWPITFGNHYEEKHRR